MQVKFAKSMFSTYSVIIGCCNKQRAFVYVVFLIHILIAIDLTGKA